MGKFKESLKEEIREEVKDIVYEKAKEEVKIRVENKYNLFRQKILNFFGIRETRKQRIHNISEEIKQRESLIVSDSVLGILELFTIEYGKSMVELTGTTVAGREILSSTKIMKQDEHDQ